ncbi:MAG: RNA degradosome polyphosphate kinase [Phascolarctobacterium sp.]|nr:RNA degradosome polyphosphate kinase [Phascolarctobacterium sp.]
MKTNPLAKPEYFYNRELSWLKFNLRVLKESMVDETPLLERLKFIAISASNMDEFFMVRVAGLANAYDEGDKKRDLAGMTAKEQLLAVGEAAHEQIKTQTKYLASLMQEMDDVGLHFRRVSELTEMGKDWLDIYFRETVYPVLTPMAIDASRPFPFISNKTQNLAIELINNDGERTMGLVQVPSVLDRIIEIPAEAKRTFIFLEDVMANYCQELFKGCKILDVVTFRVTRDSDFEVEEDEAVDLLKEMEKSLRKRKRGAVVRLEIFKNNNSRIKEFLEENLDVSDTEVYEINGPLDPTCFFKFSGLPGMWPYLYEPFVPQRPLELLDEGEDIFAAIRRKDILLHHPYESFDTVVKFVSDAADDPNVLAIKQTLYRVSGNSPIVAALARAAENGKQVTVLVELKARFDEENNIVWARRLEKAGCHVIYGLVGLKTHAKIILIVRKEDNGIRRYLHLGTGNYNDSTAKLYTDMGLMTCNDEFGADASAFFNLLSGYSDPPVWNKLTMAPLGLREKIYALVDNEIANAKAGREAHIIAKMNSLIDPGVIQKLYEASIAGVTIELIVRGICGVKVGIPGISENITVRSIVGRQLEHSRIFWFNNGGDPALYLSSADWMPRNLNDRVELFFPVESEDHIARIKDVLDLYLRDNVGAHMMQSNGAYRRVRNRAEVTSAQNVLYEMAQLASIKEKTPMEQRLQPMYSRK